MRVWVASVEPLHELKHIAREIVHIAAHMASQGSHRWLIAARGAAQA
jgi:hypothetical protein